VLGLTAREPVEVGVVRDVEEELRAARIRPSGICHGKGAGSIGVTGDILIFDVASTEALLGATSCEVRECPIVWAASACSARVGILGIGAAELVHEARDYAVEVDTFVESRLAEVDEAGRRDGDAVEVNLRLWYPQQC